MTQLGAEEEELEEEDREEEELEEEDREEEELEEEDREEEELEEEELEDAGRVPSSNHAASKIRVPPPPVCSWTTRVLLSA